LVEGAFVAGNLIPKMRESVLFLWIKAILISHHVGTDDCEKEGRVAAHLPFFFSIFF